MRFLVLPPTVGLAHTPPGVHPVLGDSQHSLRQWDRATNMENCSPQLDSLDNIPGLSLPAARPPRWKLPGEPRGESTLWGPAETEAMRPYVPQITSFHVAFAFQVRFVMAIGASLLAQREDPAGEGHLATPRPVSTGQASWASPERAEQTLGHTEALELVEKARDQSTKVTQLRDNKRTWHERDFSASR